MMVRRGKAFRRPVETAGFRPSLARPRTSLGRAVEWPVYLLVARRKSLACNWPRSLWTQGISHGDGRHIHALDRWAADTFQRSGFDTGCAGIRCAPSAGIRVATAGITGASQIAP